MSIKKVPKVPRCVILDFHDSYTRNLLRLFHLLVQRQQPDGGGCYDSSDWQERVVVINVDSLTWEDLTREVIPNIDCLILGPGPGRPDHHLDFSWSERLIQEFGHALPIFGLCLGHQGLATAFGAKIRRAVEPSHGISTFIHHAGDALFASVDNPFLATQYNSLVVDRDSVPDELEVLAWKEVKGQREVMALKHRSRPLWGVQFHPESITSSFGATILDNFLQQVLRRIPNQNSESLPPSIKCLSTKLPPLERQQQNKAYELRTAPLPWIDVTPRQAFEEVMRSHAFGQIWLDSARPADGRQRSFLCFPSASLVYDRAENAVETRAPDRSRQVRKASNFTTFLRDFAEELSSSTTSPPGESLPIGLVGSLAYECQDTLFDGPPEAAARKRRDARFALVDRVLAYDHAERSWTCSALVTLSSDAPSYCGLDNDAWLSWQDGLARAMVDGHHQERTEPLPLHMMHHLEPDMQHDDYIEAINHAKDCILSGESYELCLTTTFRGHCPADVQKDPYRLYLALRENNPAPYCAFFHLPQSDIAILSSSPERFMRIDRGGHVEMKPIKGTVARSSDPVVDAERKKWLEHNMKDRAENLMIVDLARNDLLAFCDVESVDVPKFMQVESFQTVHQLVTTIQGTLSSGITNVQAVTSAFPPGSMTGAPKLRSVRILEELESRRPRGVYSGAFGYFGVDGSADMSVVIRTLVIQNGEVTLGAGGAITHLSDPESEWQEVLTKVDAVLGRKTSTSS